ncbi:MAG: glycosyl hydrolase family 32, partial [Verrucomicrobiae bacterium]|nr:glycosyl hydrolase family 32 [Verrucomicrobiae bacterium]
GLAMLRRDGFASMKSGTRHGVLTTRPVTFQGSHLFVNAACTEGNLRVEILDEEGEIIAPFSLDHCPAISADQTLLPIQWEGGEDLSQLAGKTVRFRFHLDGGDLYSFWVSPDASGASGGYVAGGGPGFTGHRDTVGSAGYPAAN